MTDHLLLLLALTLGGTPLESGIHRRQLTVDGRERSYVVHVPRHSDPDQLAAVVLVLHGAGTNATFTIPFTGLNQKAEEAGFVAVYPNGTGAGPFLTWNAGGVVGEPPADEVDDVQFIRELLDDLQTVVPIDPQRVFATGFSGGGMMCYRLAAELSDRIAAIAPVAGAMAIETANPVRPVPVMHFHGTADAIVPFDGPNAGTPPFLTFKSVEETIRDWIEINDCPETPMVSDFPDVADDGTTVQKVTYGPGEAGSEVVLIRIDGGGHTWPGRKPPFRFLGKSTSDISANDLMWEFFARHPRE